MTDDAALRRRVEEFIEAYIQRHKECWRASVGWLDGDGYCLVCEHAGYCEHPNHIRHNFKGLPYTVSTQQIRWPEENCGALPMPYPENPDKCRHYLIQAALAQIGKNVDRLKEQRAQALAQFSPGTAAYEIMAEKFDAELAEYGVATAQPPRTRAPVDPVAAERERLAKDARPQQLRQVDNWEAEQLAGIDPQSEEGKRIKTLAHRRREQIMRS
jgi:hypothetical protein